MESLARNLNTPLEWVQPKSLQNRYELRAGDALYAVIEFLKLFGSLATAISADGRWTFKRVGFFNPRISIRNAGEETDLGMFYPRWTGTEGKLQMANGAAFTWKAANFWATQFAWQMEAGEPFIVYRQGVEDATISDWFKTQARVEVRPEARSLPQISLLVMLGWYLMILKQQDDAGAVAATSAT